MPLISLSLSLAGFWLRARFRLAGKGTDEASKRKAAIGEGEDEIPGTGTEVRTDRSSKYAIGCNQAHD